MHFHEAALVFCGIYTAVYCLPNAGRYSNTDDKYLELVRKIADQVLEEQLETKIEPPYEDIDKSYFADEREANAREHADVKNSNYPPSISKENGYLQLAREVADQYMEERAKDQESVGGRTTSDALRAFNRQSLRTQLIAEQNERSEAELQTLLLLASDGNSDSHQQRHMIDLTAKSAKPDRSCNINVNCSDDENLNLVDGKEFRTINGTCNNKNNYTWGMAGAQHRRLLPDAYGNGRWLMRTRGTNGQPLPSARKISNTVHKTTTPKIDNNDSISLALFYFMQFIDHDLAKTPEGEISRNRNCCKENPEKPRAFCMPIIVDEADNHFEKGYCMDSRRSFTLFRCNDNTKFQNQINDVTAYMDASMVYGSSGKEEKTLRSFIGGHMKESTRQFMPNSTHASELPCILKGEGPQFCYEAGDTRANVHPGLTTYHTLFVREHNRIAKLLADVNNKWSDERLYQETRKIIGAQIQHIVYTEMLPVLIREAELEKFEVKKEYNYCKSCDASMTQAFSMAYRYHHLMPHELHLGKIKGGKGENDGHVKQELAFQRPSSLHNNSYNGINEVAIGMVVSSCPYVNSLMNSATRDLLFLDERNNSVDLVALNIMRGREWGMQPYTKYRALCGLGNATSWDDLKNTTDLDEINKMKSVYASVEDVDLWVGVVTEKKLVGSISGATQSCLLAKHFANVKHADRFWYENSFSQTQLNQIKKTTLARVLCRNLPDVGVMRKQVFRTNSPWIPCSDIISDSGGDMDFESWHN
ncbi:peroxidasin homolog pxn-2-like [Mercenaria mercenaria]|uniref:peroxidasin homolog pxn-2-like n=1 Tax=Mercenaria mercenaria TaxID=6596 RepID=UPI00234F4FB1|nr:peroxidasin homolog pxn-2-like [Mercenaria mercenaria]